MKIKNLLSSTLILIIGINATSQVAVKQKEQNAIKSMCGCYEVKFNFAETFNYSKDSANYKPSKTKHDYGLEWVELVEDKENKIVLQHILITGNTEESIVKHWRQDWLYENTKFYSFFKDQTWKYTTLAPNQVKGQWTQKVYQVDDSPRYEGSASWIFADGRSYWINTTDAPLPRREHTKRSDYNVLKRRNIHEITSYGWLHEQDNNKIVRHASGIDVLLAQEKGYDTYTKVEANKCKLAQDYWKKNNLLWAKVRAKWDAVFDKDKDLSLEKSVDKKPIFMFLFDLKPDTNQTEIDKIIDQFVIK